MMSNFSYVQIFPYNLERIEKLEIFGGINVHARLRFTAVIQEAETDKYLAETTIATPIEVINISPTSLGNDVLFKGVAQDVKIKAAHGVYLLEVEAVSYTYLLDIVKKKRSFQDAQMTYDELTRQILQDYPRADVIHTVGNEIPLGEFILQYEETDWEFMMRLASKFSAGLVAAYQESAPKFFFGTPQGLPSTMLANINYTVEKNVGQAQKTITNSALSLTAIENDFITYRVESTQLLKIGQPAVFQRRNFYVKDVTFVKEKQVLTYYYTLVTTTGLMMPRKHNKQIVGASIEGAVIDVKWDEIKIHFDIDAEQDKEKACWFLYSSMYMSSCSTGWYFMPEIGDRVRVYFASEREISGVAMSSVYQEEDVEYDNNYIEGEIYSLNRSRFIDTDVKSIKTKYKKEIILSPTAIVIHGEGMYITLEDGKGIEVATENDIHFKAKANVFMEAENIVIEGQKSVNLTCQDHSVNMNKNQIAISGPKLRVN